MLLGLDIGSSSLRACSLVLGEEGRSLEVFETEDLPEGAVVNGVIRQSSVVIEALREVLLRADSERCDLAISLPHSASFVLETTLSFDGRRYDVDAAREFIAPHIPSAWGEFNLSIAPIQAQQPSRVILAAAPRAAIQSLRHIAEEAGANLIGIDAAPCVLMNTAELCGELRGSTALVDIGLRETRLIFTEQAGIYATSTIPKGGQDLTEALRTTLGLSAQEAEAYKLGGDTPDEGLVPRDVHEQLQNFCAALSQGIAKALKSVPQAAGKRMPARVVMFGRTAQLSLFQQALAGVSGMTIAVADPLGHVQTNPLDFSPAYLHAVRAASGIAAGTVLPFTE